MLGLMEMVRMCVSGSVLTRAEREAIERLRERRRKATRFTADGHGYGRRDDEEDSDAPIVSYRIPEVLMLRKNGHPREKNDVHTPDSSGTSKLKRMLAGVGRKARGGGSVWKNKERSGSVDSDSSMGSGTTYDGRTESDEYFLRCFQEE